MNLRLGARILALLWLLAHLVAASFTQEVDVKVHIETINGRVPLSLAHLWGQRIEGLTADSVTYEMVRVEVQNNLPKLRTFHLKLELQGLGGPCVKTVSIGPMARAFVSGSPALNWDIVSGWVDERVGNLSVQLEEAGSLIYSDVLPVRLAGKDDIPIYAGSKPLYFLFVTRVQPKSKLVTEVLSQASQRMGFQWRKGIVGYQGYDDAGQMYEDIRKIYKTIQAMNFTYVNTPFSFEEGYQRVKTPAEALGDRTGNCIDGTLVFASCIAAIGYNPIIAIIPGHALVIATLPPRDLSGTRMARRRLNSMALRGGEPALPSYYISWLPIETTVLQGRSQENLGLTRTTFEEAVRTATEELREAGPAKTILVDVDAWRACGLLPSPEMR